MRRIALALALSAIATASIFASSAAASGPAAPGKEVIEVECAGLGPVTVSAPKPEKSHGAAQIVGQKGHGIGVSFTFTATDLRTGEVLFSETEKAPGKAHSHQATTTCTGTFAEVPASQFFEGHELPPEVEPGDIIQATFEGQIIIKR
ncbi:MAG: hypothetical protein E6F96_07090 [Actinobacteria bacterium]|nr:MAG: hypothetical protein E6F96_07090 [Actinomycetota bacterium]